MEDNRRGGNGRRTEGRRDYGKRPRISNSNGERRSFGSDRPRRSFGENNGERSSFGGERRSFSSNGGERRRLEIARALASQPNYILLDEPLAGIDPIAVGEIRNLVSQLKHRGLGVLITDHNVRETLDITDRAYILHGGTVLMEGTPEEIVANEEVRKVYLGDNFSM